MKYTDNTQTLEDLLKPRGTEEDYADFINVLTKTVKRQYAEYQFLRQDPMPDDFETANCLVFQLFPEDFMGDYEYLFKLAIDKCLVSGEITKKFITHVKEGHVVPLGDVEVEDLGTGVSPILQSRELKVLISFTPADRVQIRDEKRAELLKAREEQMEAQLEKQKIAKEASENLKNASKVLATLTEKEIKANELEEQYILTEKLFHSEIPTNANRGLRGVIK